MENGCGSPGCLVYAYKVMVELSDCMVIKCEEVYKERITRWSATKCSNLVPVEKKLQSEDGGDLGECG